MALMSKLAALALCAAAMLNVHASPAVITAVAHVQASSPYQQAAVRPAPTQGQAMSRPAANAPAPSPVPEPIHYKLMLLGLAMLLALGRRGATPSKPWTK
jgi:hypothetical protein